MTVVLGKCISAASFPGKILPAIIVTRSPLSVLFGVRLMFVEQREPTGNLKVEYSGNERLEIQCDFKLKYKKYTPKKLHYKNKIYIFVSNNVVNVFRMKPIAITIYYSLIRNPR